MSKIDIKSTAKGIVDNLGGRDNIASISHCATRLRVYLKDNKKINENKILKVPGVIATDKATDQYQVILGQIVVEVYDEITKNIGNIQNINSSKDHEKRGLIAFLGRFFEFIAGIMQPIIPALSTAGFLKVILVIMSLLGIQDSNSTYQMLSFLSDTVFYFLPVFVAYASAKKFNTNIIIALILSCAMLHPSWTAIVNLGNPMTYFGLPVFLTNYSTTFIQIILTVWIMSYVEKWVKKVIPVTLSHFLVPLFVTLIMSVILFVATGPLGGYFSGAIKTFIVWVKGATGGFAPAIVTFLGPWIAMGGMHLALVPFAVQQIAEVGYDDLINIWFLCFTISAGAVALAVSLRTKNKNLKQISIPAAISGLFGGISEPTTYGISMKMVKPYWANLIASTVAAIYAGLVHLKAYAFGAYSLTSLLAYMGTEGDMTNFIHACITVAIDIVLTIALVYIFGYDDSIYDDEDTSSKTKIVKSDKIISPAKGKLIKQEEINDKTFASGSLGPCFGIKPSSNDIFSPINGTIKMVYPTKHAIGILGDNGDEVLVHIGLNSVELKGEGLENFVKVNDIVTTKTKIATIDNELFNKKGIDNTIIVILTNSDAFSKVKFIDNESTNSGSLAMEIEA